VPTPIGAAPTYHPAALSRATAAARPIAGLRCESAPGERDGAHLELFAQGLVVIVPAGIGVAPPVRRNGAAIAGGRCSYPARTIQPTGVIELARGAKLTLGDFFAVWGQPLSTQRLAGFRGGAVKAFVGGVAWRGDPRSIPLRRHGQIVLELGPLVPPHAAYLFPPGL
jgi:hypothetical protein